MVQQAGEIRHDGFLDLLAVFMGKGTRRFFGQRLAVSAHPVAKGDIFAGDVHIDRIEIHADPEVIRHQVCIGANVDKRDGWCYPLHDLDVISPNMVNLTVEQIDFSGQIADPAITVADRGSPCERPAAQLATDETSEAGIGGLRGKAAPFHQPTESQTGWKGKPTSEEAAHHAALTAPKLRAAVLNVMKVIDRPMTADEVAQAMNLSVLSIRPRISELAKAGKLIDTGERGKNRSGRSAVRWKVAEARK